MLFNHCSDEFGHVQKVKSVIEDLYEIRSEKLMSELKKIDPETPVKYLSSAGAVEVNAVRESFGAAYGIAGKMQNIIEKCIV
jgi:hypothetical protein